MPSKRWRSKEHLKKVVDNPCVICNNPLVQAHHLTIVEPKARGLKSSDFWTLPLCSKHHRELHDFGDERLYWILYAKDPVELCKEYWNDNVRKVWKLYQGKKLGHGG